MTRDNDPFVIKEWGGDIADQAVRGWSQRNFEGSSLGEPGIGSLKRIINQKSPIIIFTFLLLGISILVARLIWLQVWQGNYWLGVAEGNRIRTEIINPSRGIIVDSQSRLLAGNTASFRLVAVPAEMPKDEIKREEYLTEVLAGVPTELLLQDNLTKLAQKSYLPLIIASSLSHEMALKLMTLVDINKGLRVEPNAERIYTGGESFAHVIGYVGLVTAEEYKTAAGRYGFTDSKGKVGLELKYEELLRGQPGLRQVEVDASGLERKIFSARSPVAGAKLKLTINKDLQDLSYETLKRAVQSSRGRGGAVVVMNPLDGSILAITSYPSYNPNVFTAARNSAEISRLLNDSQFPLYNRAISGEYPSGSTIKPLVAAAALQEKVITVNTTFLSTGGVYAGRQFFADWRSGGHGLTNVYKAIAESVNTFFYLVGGGSNEFVGLGITRLSDYFKKFGLSKLTGIDLPGERAGFVPTALWKLAATGEHWYRGDTYNISIGQGNLLVTPIQMAVAYAALLNNGELVKPRLLDTIFLASGEQIKTSKELNGQVKLEPSVLAAVKQGMRQTVLSGSARSLGNLPIAVAGKTGTAQTGPQTATHAWFVGYAPFDNPDIVVVVIIENGGEGSQAATPVAREIFSWWSLHKP